MKNTFASIALAIMAILGSTCAAQARLIDFNGLSGTSIPGGYAASTGHLYTYFNGPVTLQGVTFTPALPHPYQYVSGDLNAQLFCRGDRENCAQNGTDYLLTSPVFSFARSDGGVFDLNGFDLGNWFDSSANKAAPAQTSFIVTAERSGGGSASLTITLDDIPNYVSGAADELNHFRFDGISGFSGITKVTVQQVGTRDFEGTVLDNLDVTAGAAGEAPEPGVVVLVALGLAGIIRIRRRREA